MITMTSSMTITATVSSEVQSSHPTFRHVRHDATTLAKPALTSSVRPSQRWLVPNLLLRMRSVGEGIISEKEAWKFATRRAY
mmetsp:Transcript_53131/g.159005  ORF Transcript_53131/g.159005 Transcript_53131/m.159005 type:complete len:82 (-) Transcript_53131:3665-3910(-)